MAQLSMPRNIAIIGYTLFVALSVYHIAMHKDFMDAGSALGIGLIFDPYAPTEWQSRTALQRAHLIIHVAAVFGLLGYGWFGS